MENLRSLIKPARFQWVAVGVWVMGQVGGFARSFVRSEARGPFRDLVGPRCSRPGLRFPRSETTEV